MKRVGLALGLTLAVALTLVPARAWASHGHAFVAIRSGHVSVFIHHGHPFVHRHFLFRHHPHVLHRHHAVHHGVIHPHFRSTIIVVDPVIVVPKRVWAPGLWR
ncbi:MAG: hypothetical protein ACRDIF_00535 [Actinomycetota bacterium]